jgi:hypothetical protein
MARVLTIGVCFCAAVAALARFDRTFSGLDIATGEIYISPTYSTNGTERIHVLFLACKTILIRAYNTILFIIYHHCDFILIPSIDHKVYIKEGTEESTSIPSAPLLWINTHHCLVSDQPGCTDQVLDLL